MEPPDNEESKYNTVTSAGGSAAASAYKATLIQSAGRFELQEKLGQGGMGEVYKAYDPDLGRPVALKFLRGDDPELLARFQQEAKAQARLDSKHICKVYEVGEAEGRRYIAMQFIAGQTLAHAASRMNIEQKVAILRDMAEAVHSAHKQGLIHRDVKPQNIMVEKTDDGHWQAYMMDFGLVRDQAAEGMTMTGVIMGTPGYMPPEQLRGEVHLLDRRADVYALGATLYFLLCGRAPYGDRKTTNVMFQVLETDPTPLCVLDKNIPLDLETIALKCLEKEPNQRYDSAKALADDLRRYLDGDPIQARRANWIYRLQKKTRKHKALVAVGSIASVLLLMMAFYSVQQRMEASRREEAAQRFGQQVKEIESLMRISHLMPLHNTLPEKKRIRMTMAAIEQEKANGASEGPADYALGKGHLVLRDFEAAQRELQNAYDEGYQLPEVAYNLGQVLGILYNKGLKQAVRLGNDDLIQARKKELIKKYRNPALNFLKQSRGLNLEAPEYLEALLAFYERRYDEALEKTRSVSTQLPWMYEAYALEGEIYRTIGYDQITNGSYDAARRAYDSAESAYREAIKIGESDSAMYEGLAEIDLARIETEIYGEGKDTSGYLNQALDSASKALKANPESGNAWSMLARAYSREAEHQRDNGLDPRSALQKSIEAAEQAVKFSPDLSGNHRLLEANRILATYLVDRGLDPTESVNSAQDAYQHALQFEPNHPDTYNVMGLCYRELGGYQNRTGKDPRAVLKKAIDAYQKSIDCDPKSPYPYNNMGNTYVEIAQYELEQKMDPGENIRMALDICEKAIRINPNFAYPFNNMSTAFNIQAQYEIQQQIDPASTWQKAIDAAQKAVKVKSTFAPAYGNMARAYQQMAEYQASKGIDPRTTIKQALEFADQALTINSQSVSVQGYAAFAYLALARYEAHRGLDPTAALNFSREFTQKALKINPNYFEARLANGIAAIVEGKWLMQRHRDPSALFEQARNIIEDAGKIKPAHPRLAAARAELSSPQRH